MLLTNLCQHLQDDVIYESAFPMEMGLSCGTLPLLPQSHVLWSTCSNATELGKRNKTHLLGLFLGKINVRVEIVGFK